MVLNQIDYGQNACDLCAPNTWNPGKKCTGVVGAATINQKAPAPTTPFDGKNKI